MSRRRIIHAAWITDEIRCYVYDNGTASVVRAFDGEVVFWTRLPTDAEQRAWRRHRQRGTPERIVIPTIEPPTA